MNFSSRLKELRLAKGISQLNLANECNISLRALIYYEKNQRSPSLEVLITLANYFDVSIDYLVGESDDPSRH